MQIFTFMDHVAGRCSAAEIDMPHEPRWSRADCSMGLCGEEQIGTRKQLPGQQSLPEDATLDDMTVDVLKTELEAYRRDPDRYRQQSATNLNKLLDLLSRRQERELANSRPDNRPVDQLTSEELHARLIGRIAEMPAVDHDIIDATRRGLDHLLEQFVPASKRAEARIVTDSIIAHLERCSGQSASDGESV